MKLADRYIELILDVQKELKRELFFDEIQLIKWMVAKEFGCISHVSRVKQPIIA